MVFRAVIGQKNGHHQNQEQRNGDIISFSRKQEVTAVMAVFALVHHAFCLI